MCLEIFCTLARLCNKNPLTLEPKAKVMASLGITLAGAFPFMPFHTRGRKVPAGEREGEMTKGDADVSTLGDSRDWRRGEKQDVKIASCPDLNALQNLFRLSRLLYQRKNTRAGHKQQA